MFVSRKSFTFNNFTNLQLAYHEAKGSHSIDHSSPNILPPYVAGNSKRSVTSFSRCGVDAYAPARTAAP